MINTRKIFLHGGSSLISKSLISKFKNDFDELHVFCRDIKKAKNNLEIETYKDKKFIFYENDLNNLDLTLNHINDLPNDLKGVFWISGYTGDPDIEFNKIESAKQNLNINFTNVVLSLTKLVEKIEKKNDSFICVITSVSGLRGRKKRLYYAAAKGGLINFLSGLRQKLNNKIKVFTVIPGYIFTNAFKEKTNKLLIVSVEDCSNLIYEGIKRNKHIIYVNTLWRIIMWFIILIPEKIFKKLKF